MLFFNMNIDKYKVNLVKLSEILGKTEIIDTVTLDGGRTSFYCENQGTRFWLRTVHNGLESTPYKEGYWPGGLYLNEELIEVHSEKEKQIINLLSKIKIPKKQYSIYYKELDTNDGKILEELVQFIIEFLNSEKYIALAKKTGRLL